MHLVVSQTSNNRIMLGKRIGSAIRRKRAGQCCDEGGNTAAPEGTAGVGSSASDAISGLFVVSISYAAVSLSHGETGVVRFDLRRGLQARVT